MLSYVRKDRIIDVFIQSYGFYAQIYMLDYFAFTESP